MREVQRERLLRQLEVIEEEVERVSRQFLQQQQQHLRLDTKLKDCPTLQQFMIAHIEVDGKLSRLRRQTERIDEEMERIEQEQPAPAQDLGRQMEVLEPSADVAVKKRKTVATLPFSSPVYVSGRTATKSFHTAPQDEQKGTEEGGKKRKFEHTTIRASPMHRRQRKRQRVR